MTTGQPTTTRLTTLGVAHDRATVVAAVVLRLVAAYLWFDNLSWKNPPDFGQSDKGGLYGYTEGAIAHPVLGAWSSVIEKLVLPNFTLFGWFTFITEGCLALFLFLGLATRFWAAVGMLQSLAIYLTVSAQPGEWKWSYWLMAATHLAILGLAAGRVLGLDQIVRRRVHRPSLPARLYRLAS